MGKNINITMDWKGLPEAESLFAMAVVKSDEQTKAVVKNHTELLQKRVREYAPKPGGSRYGKNPYAEGALSSNVKAVSRGPYVGLVSPTMKYAGYVNSGTRFMAAQPFATDAFNDQVPEFEKDLRDVIVGAFE